MRRDVERGGDVEVDPPADDPGGHRPQQNVVHQSTLAADRDPPATGDVDGQADPDHVHQPVEVQEERPQVDAVDRRARDEGKISRYHESTILDR
jgi:hypothetical protein